MRKHVDRIDYNMNKELLDNNKGYNLKLCQEDRDMATIICEGYLQKNLVEKTFIDIMRNRWIVIKNPELGDSK